uniref:SFRICE_008831 n=1 Tax=Spodoptera frugiperda TaxID=7108 RepID=A0A2H1VV47_SPOFR
MLGPTPSQLLPAKRTPFACAYKIQFDSLTARARPLDNQTFRQRTRIMISPYNNYLSRNCNVSRSQLHEICVSEKQRIRPCVRVREQMLYVPIISPFSRRKSSIQSIDFFKEI